MQPEKQKGAPDRPTSDAAPESLLEEQREANEKLVLSALGAQEKAAEALEARVLAEDEASKLRATTEDLRATAEFRERLIGIIGHDLRNPLNTISMSTGYMISRGSLSADDARMANRIVSSAHRMAGIIDQLVEFTRARLGGGFDLNLKLHDLGVICENIAEELRISSSGDIRVTMTGKLTGHWDRDRLEEVVSNLVGNAVEHAARETPVWVNVRDEGEWVAAEITNRGVCIPPEIIPVIFKPFRRGGMASAKAGHLGLGLYIAFEITRAHGGTLDVRSSDGITTFILRMPRLPLN